MMEIEIAAAFDLERPLSDIDGLRIEKDGKAETSEKPGG